MNDMEYNEYQMLRNENMEYLRKKDEVRKFTITTTITVLTLAGSEIWKDTAILYLLPLIVIILGIINTISMEKRIKEIIAYRIVFLENGEKDIRWTRAITKYNKAYGKKIKLVEILQKFDYAILAMLCLVLYVNKFGDNIIKTLTGGLYFKPLILLSGVLMLLFIYVLYLSMIRNRLASNEEFKEYVQNWKKIKKENLDF